MPCVKCRVPDALRCSVRQGRGPACRHGREAASPKVRQAQQGGDGAANRQGRPGATASHAPAANAGPGRSRSACPGHPAVCLVRRPAAIRRAAGQNSCTVAPGRGELRASFFDLRGFSLAAAAPPVVWGGGTPRRMPFFRRVSCCPLRPPRAKQAATPPGCGPFLPWRPGGGRARSRPGVRLCKIFVPTGAFRGEDVKKIKRTLDGS